MSRIITHIGKTTDKTIHLDLDFTLDSFLPLYSQIVKHETGSPMFMAALHKMLRKCLVGTRFLKRLQQFVASLPSYPTGQPISEVYWRSLVLDNESTAPAQWGRDIEWLCEVGDLLEKGTDPFDAVPELSTLLGIDEEVFYLRLGMRATSWSCGIGVLVAFAGIIKSIRARSLPSFRTVALFIPAWAVSTVAIVLFSNFVCQYWFRGFVFQSSKSSREVLLKTSRTPYELADSLFNLRGRKLCITDNGYVAWVPETTRPGDQICHLRGSRLPFVIRSQEQEQEQDLPAHQKVMQPEKAEPELERKSYKLIGDCYIHGMMADKALDRSDEEYCRVSLI